MRYCLAAGFSLCAAIVSADAPAWAPVDLGTIFGRSAESLIVENGPGEPRHGKSAEGEFLIAIEYTEAWFGEANPVRVEYHVNSAEPPQVTQITVHFPDDADRTALIERITGYLGEAEQGPSDESAPSVYFANWIRDAVRYDFQDYGDYKEMYIAPARFSPTDRYNLPEETLEVQRAMGTVFEKGAQHMAFLLGLRPDAANPAIQPTHLFVRKAGDDFRVGVLTPLPTAAAGGSPQLFLHDFDGDGLDDAFIRAVTDGRTVAWVVGLKAKQGTVLLDAGEGSIAELGTGGFAGIDAVDADGDGVWALDVESAEGVHATIHLKNGKWVEHKPE